MDLRILSIDHLAPMVEIDQRCFGGHWSVETYQRELESPNAHFIGRFVSHWDGGAVGTAPPEAKLEQLVGIGCFWAILDEAHITLMAILPEYRGQGWGKDLLVGLLAEAVAIGMNHATLEVRPSNTIAVGLYEKMGFETLGRRKKYYQNPEEDALIMWCRSLQHPDFMKRYAN
jgi:[ribosomal protein S18]-alanine N-acetyltransferase